MAFAKLVFLRITTLFSVGFTINRYYLYITAVAAAPVLSCGSAGSPRPPDQSAVRPPRLLISVTTEVLRETETPAPYPDPECLFSRIHSRPPSGRLDALRLETPLA